MMTRAKKISCLKLAAAFVVAWVAFAPSAAFAACSTPTANAGAQFYNTTYNQMQFCNGTNWVNMGSSGSISGIGTLTAGNFCTTDGTVINCTTGAINLTSQVSGTLQAAQFPALTGDVTTSVGSLATSIGAGKVTNTMLAGSINISKILATGTASATTYLRGDGTWTAPSGGTPAGSTAQIQYNNAGAFGADSGFTYAGSGAVTITGAAATALSVTTTNTSGYGIYSSATATTGSTYGGTFANASTSGVGVQGLATATTGTTFGGNFTNSSSGGTGVIGIASATTGGTVGAYGRSDSVAGYGVYGSATAATGNTYGGTFANASTSGVGVQGISSATTGATFGGAFSNASTSGTGIQVISSATTGTTYGALISNASSGGTGLFISAGNATTKGIAVRGAASQTGTLTEWQANGGGVLSFVDASGNLALPTSGYLNFGATTGTSGYGFKDNAGTIQYKNSGGSWTNIGGGGASTFAAGTVALPGWAVTGDTDTGLFQPASTPNTLSITAGGVEAIRFNTITSGVNYLSMTPGATGSAVTIAAAGSDTNISVALTPKGSGTVNVSSTKLLVGGAQAIYNANATYVGSIFYGNGGASLSHTTASEGYYNTGVGIGALLSNTTAYWNTATGYSALNSNTTGGANTANGYAALFLNTTGTSNMASGAQALQSNISGNSNTASGSQALYSNTTSSNNTANGNQALYSNTTGAGNTASGGNSLQYNTAGSLNTASGFSALYTNTTGNNNTASGSYAMFANTTGSYNTANGYYALSANTTGANNTAYGYGAGGDITTGSNNTMIGSYPTASIGITTGSNNIIMGFDVRPPSQTASNQLNIGNLIYGTGLGTAATLSTGSVGIGTATPNHTFDVNGNIGLAAAGYINFGSTDGTSGYGFKDNAGTLQYKNSGGSWTNLGGGGSTFAAGTVSAPGWAVTGDTNTGLFQAASAADTLSISAGGVEVTRFNTVASAVNYFSLSPSATGNAITLAAAGSDTNVGIILTPKGTGGIGIGTTNATSLLDIRQTSTATTGATLQNLRFALSPASSATYFTGVQNAIYPAGLGTVTSVTGASNSIVNVGSSGGAIGTETGALNSVNNNGGDTVTTAIGSDNVVTSAASTTAIGTRSTVNLSSSGTITNATGLSIAANAVGGGSIGTAKGIDITTSGSPSVTNWYGMYIQALSGFTPSTARYPIYVADTGTSYFAGGLQMAASNYVNFGATAGTSGYGIRDNAGTIECKNSGGSWAACAGGGGGGSTFAAGLVGTPGWAVTGDTDTGLWAPAANTLSTSAGGVEVLRLNTIASGVDYFTMTPGATGTPGVVTLGAAGSDTDVSIAITPKGAGLTAVSGPLTVTGTKTDTSGTVNLTSETLAVNPASDSTATFYGRNTAVNTQFNSTINMGTIYGTSSAANINNNTSTVAAAYGAINTVGVGNRGVTVTNAYGTFSYVSNSSNVGNAIGSYARVVNSSSTTSATGVFAEVYNNTATSIGTVKNVEIKTTNRATNWYGLYINSLAGTVTGIVDRYPIYSLDSGTSYFTGGIQIAGTSQYLNFGTTAGTSGYGIRDNAGTIECKNSGGSWAACAGGGGGSTFAAGLVGTPGWAVTGDTDTGLWAPAANTLSTSAGGVEVLRLNTVASGVNYLSITPGAAGSDVTIAAAGSDTNVNVAITPKGSGVLNLTSGRLVINGNNAIALPNTAQTTVVGASGLVTTGNAGIFATAVGAGALNVNTSGQYNTAIGVYALNSNTSGGSNTASGMQSLSLNTTGSNNTANGYGALYANTSGGLNTAVGYNALSNNTTGVQNTASGANALNFNTTGNYNTAHGQMALSANTTGTGGTATGFAALTANTTGAQNTAFGTYSVNANTTGGFNTGLGYGALGNNTSGSFNLVAGNNAGFGASGLSNVSYNVMLGYKVGYNILTGADSNTMVGYQAGYNLTTGAKNLLLGYYSGAGGVTTGSDNILIGDDVRPQSVTASNQLNIGNLIYATGLGTAAVASTGYVGIGSSAPAAALDVVGDIHYTGVITDVSDRRLKENIKALSDGELSKILALKPITFTMKKNPSGTEFGFIAQEVEEIYPDLVKTNKDAMQTKSLNYVGFISPIVKAVQELSANLDKLSATVTVKVIGELKDFGLMIEKGATRISALAANALTVGTAERPSGITLYDEDTKAPYCLKMKGGKMLSIPGACAIDVHAEAH